MRRFTTSLLLLLICTLNENANCQTTVSLTPDSILSPIGNRFKHGVFFVPKTAEAQQDLYSNDHHYNAIRLHIIESALNNTSNLNDCLAFLDAVQGDLQLLSSKTDKVIFIFEKMPAWLSSSSDGSPATTPGWYVLNTKPPANYAAWNSTVDAITNRIVNTYGIANAYFEIWNEPDLGSWTASDAEYFELFKNTYDAIKGVDATLPVGGPATNYWGNHINYQAPYGYLNSTNADQSLIGALLDSSVVWNRPLDFVSWHNFHVIHAIQDNILSYLNQKCTGLGIALPETIISEWNTNSAIRETSLQHSFFIKNQLALANLPIDNHVIAAWQDFTNSAQEFHNDYGLLSYGSIHKPAYKTMILSNKLAGNEILHESTEQVDMVAAVKNDTLQILLTNYVSDPFVEALNETLFSGGFNLNQLDSAGYIDIVGADVSYLDSIYQGLVTISGTTPIEIAINEAIPTYNYYASLLNGPRSFNIDIQGISSITGSEYYRINDTLNNSKFVYDSLINSGFNQSGAISYIVSDQSLQPSSLSISGNSISFQTSINEVAYIELKIPELLGMENLNKNTSMIYPNPTSDRINVISTAILGTVQIRNISGQTVFEKNIQEPMAELSLASQSSGVYFISVESTGEVHKVVKL